MTVHVCQILLRENTSTQIQAVQYYEQYFIIKYCEYFFKKI